MSLSDTVSAAKATRDGAPLIADIPFAQFLGMRLELDQQELLFLAHIAPVDRKSHFAGNARWRDGGFSRKRSYVAFVVDKWIDWHAKTS